jgi:predicted ester cyclase
MLTFCPMTTESIIPVAEAFFEACETGRGWSACSAFCTPDATFSAQAEPLADVTTLAGYTDWMQGISAVFPGASYDLMAWAVDEVRRVVVAYATFNATHTGEGGPVPPTGKSMNTDYVYVMQFAGNKIAHMTKIWNSGLALKAIGWV